MKTEIFKATVILLYTFEDALNYWSETTTALGDGLFSEKNEFGIACIMEY